ncbi:urease accessory protein UreD [Sinomonas mesophila]|uniref:urease accessory protein UreD n=1 Tax=Sinomonas mesophila TaxID=1531955 RepID=UPI001FE8880B|nr:urease accessory protein UreD [Sinomonas mesophila]
MTARAEPRVRSGPGEPTTAGPRLTGQLRLGLELRAGRTVAARQFHEGALRVLRALYPDGTGQPMLTVVNPGGGYLGGDTYATEVALGPGASALLTTQSATKVYRTPQGPARAVLRLSLGPGSRLESVPDALIAYRGAAYRQDTEVAMAPDASLALADVVTHGWSPDGEPFRFDEVFLRTRVAVDGRLAVADNLVVRPADGGTARLMLAGRSHLGSLLVVDPRADDAAVAALRSHLGIDAAPGAGATAHDGARSPRVVAAHDGARSPRRGTAPLAGITRLAVPGFALRVLADSTQSAEAVLHAALNWMRSAWHGQGPLDTRKP